MRPSTASGTKAPTLPRVLNDRLSAYALAAGAAGVAALASASPSEAKIIYTPLNVQIASHHSFRFDLNHDGIADFEVKNNVFRTADIGGNTLLAKPLVSNNAVAGMKGLVNTLYASAFKSGSVIGPALQFSGKLMAASGTEYGSVGRWQNVTNRYLGLKFYVAGKLHFGWARLSVSSGTGNGITAIFTGFAYETSVGTPIIAGKTTSTDNARAFPPLDASHVASEPLSETREVEPMLGLLAAGASALPIWKREGEND